VKTFLVKIVISRNDKQASLTYIIPAENSWEAKIFAGKNVKEEFDSYDWYYVDNVSEIKPCYGL
jgi:hypothetical protein